MGVHLHGKVTGQTMIILLDYPPSTNRLWRSVNGRQYVSPEAKAWKQAAAWKAKQLGVRMGDMPVRVRVTLHPRLTKQGKASAVRIDLDNGIKAALDAFNGIAYVDDSQVREINARIGEPLLNGGLTVGVSEVIG